MDAMPEIEQFLQMADQCGYADAAQEASLELLRNGQTLDIALLKCRTRLRQIDQYRKNRRCQVITDVLPPSGEIHGDDSPNDAAEYIFNADLRLERRQPHPAQQLIDEEDCKVVHRALHTLKTREADVIRRCDMGGERVSDVATSLGCPPATVYTNRRRGRIALQSNSQLRRLAHGGE